MTDDMLAWEKESGIFGKKLMEKLHAIKYTESNGKVSIRCTCDDDVKLNFGGGATSRYVVCTVMAEVDRQNAGELNMKRKVEGTTAIERLRTITKKITSGSLHLDARQSKLDCNLMNEVKRKHIESKQIDLQ